MKKLLLAASMSLLAAPVWAAEYTIKEVSDLNGAKPYSFEPSELVIQPGDTVTFVNAQDDMHDVMFVEVPKGVDGMIMSPIHEKEGDKFSYTFNVPGTYSFHCHPHEAAGMKGVLIVGQTSKPGETVKMDHHKMSKMHGDATMGSTQGGQHDQQDVAADMVQATGKINSIDIAKGTINITHDPVEALGWPKMTMGFPVEERVDLSSLKAGDTVSFALKAKGEYNYVIVRIGKTN